MIRASRSVTSCFFTLALVVMLDACSRDKAESKAPPATPSIPVAVSPVEQKPMPLQLQAIGTVEALSTVSVRAQVGGELMRVHFKEGQDVKKGDLLFTIDPRSFEAALAQAQAMLAKDTGLVQQARAALQRDRARVLQSRAALARDQAQARTADAEAKRYAELYKRELISLEQSEQFHTTAESLAATVRADEADITSAEETVRADEAAIKAAEQTVRGDEAMVDNAKIQLGYTRISSPIDGRTGSLMLHEGNIVRAGGTTDSTLVVINQIQPVYVSFTVPQQQLPTIRRYMAEGPLEVRATPAGDTQPQRGTVSFVDNVVDATTGTIRLKGTFTNAERRLWPGQFANVELVLSTEPDAIVVPAQAVQTGQGNSTFVFVVKDDSTAETRRITVKRTQGSETVVSDGLKPGEKVVTDGMPRLVAGAKVEIRTPGQEGGRPGGGRRPGGGAPGGAAPGGAAPDAGGKAPAKAQP
jgi:membrane fusion protein, multidrug efflux system